MHFKMLSAICFNMSQSKIFSSGNELKEIMENKTKNVLENGEQLCLEDDASNTLLHRYSF